MVVFLGWISTILILLGYTFNARLQHRIAMIVWIIGDIGWVTYDIIIHNWSHMVLSFLLIGLNLLAIRNITKKPTQNLEF